MNICLNFKISYQKPNWVFKVNRVDGSMGIYVSKRPGALESTTTNPPDEFDLVWIFVKGWWAARKNESFARLSMRDMLFQAAKYPLQESEKG